jgi:hypothetical protein
MSAEAPMTGSLKEASINRLACLFRHWTWANEAMAQFERELAAGWEDDEDPVARVTGAAFVELRRQRRSKPRRTDMPTYEMQLFVAERAETAGAKALTERGPYFAADVGLA